MAKILKRLFIFLLIFIVPHSVFADSKNIYWYNIYTQFNWNNFSSAPSNYTTYNFDIDEDSFIMNYAFNNRDYARISFVVYDTIEDNFVMFILEYDKNLQCDLNNEFDLSSPRYFTCIDNDNNVSSTTRFSVDYFGLLSKENLSTYLNNFFNRSDAYSYKSGDYYITQNSLKGWFTYYEYFVNNHDNFKFVGGNNNLKLKYDGLEFSPYNETTPETTPETDSESDSSIYNFNNNKYYVPNYEKGNCVEILDKDTIRVFKDETTSYYIDYYINSNYISKQGQVDIDYEKKCSTLEFTDIRYYGNDFPQILFIFLVVSIGSIGFIYILYKRFRKR